MNDVENMSEEAKGFAGILPESDRGKYTEAELEWAAKNLAPDPELDELLPLKAGDGDRSLEDEGENADTVTVAGEAQDDTQDDGIAPEGVDEAEYAQAVERLKAAGLEIEQIASLGAKATVLAAQLNQGKGESEQEAAAGSQVDQDSTTPSPGSIDVKAAVEKFSDLFGDDAGEGFGQVMSPLVQQLEAQAKTIAQLQAAGAESMLMAARNQLVNKYPDLGKADVYQNVKDLMEKQGAQVLRDTHGGNLEAMMDAVAGSMLRARQPDEASYADRDRGQVQTRRVERARAIPQTATAKERDLLYLQLVHKDGEQPAAARRKVASIKIVPG